MGPLPRGRTDRQDDSPTASAINRTYCQRGRKTFGWDEADEFEALKDLFRPGRDRRRDHSWPLLSFLPLPC